MLSGAMFDRLPPVGPSFPGINIKPAPLPAMYSAKKLMPGSPPAGKRGLADVLVKRCLQWSADDVHPKLWLAAKFPVLPKIGNVKARTPKKEATLEAVPEASEMDDQ